MKITHILQIGLASAQGGVESTIVNYFLHINKQKVMFDFAGIAGTGIAYADTIINHGGKIYVFPDCRKHPLKVAKLLMRTINDNHYDVVHINALSAANLVPIIVACFSKATRVIVHSHNSDVPKTIAKKFLHAFNVHILRHMPVTKWACGKKAGEWMWGHCFDFSNVIPNAIVYSQFARNESKRNYIRSLYNIPSECKVLGFVGHLYSVKNPLFLLDIFYYLKQLIPNAKLLIVGDGPERQQVIEKAKNLKIDSSTIFTGYQKEVSTFYQAMDVLALPSLFEGLPVVAIEAQACGLPCFFSDQITKEVDITGDVHFLSLQLGAKIWAQSISARLGENRMETRPFPAKYKIEEAAQELEKRYTNLVKR